MGLHQEMYYADCDDCGRERDHLGYLKGEAIEQLRKEGWMVRSNGDTICNDCRTREGK